MSEINLISDDESEVVIQATTTSAITKPGTTASTTIAKPGKSTEDSFEIKVINVQDASRTPIEVTKGTTLRALANQIQAALKVPREAQRLIFKGRELKSMTKSISSLGVSEGQFIHMATKPKVLAKLAKKTQSAVMQQGKGKKRKAGSKTSSHASISLVEDLTSPIIQRTGKARKTTTDVL